jgi:predicted extracellular nuclease
MKAIVTALLVIVTCLSGSAQNKDREFTVVFYNVENLFDTEDDPRTEDEEFTPEAEKHWTLDRYEKKLEDLAMVLSSINENELPEVIGLCEVENRNVLEDLINIRRLRRGKYRIIHEESPDTRGIDVAFLYREDHFRVTDHRTIPVTFPYDSSETTRDILYVTGTADNREELHFFVNHWPSRLEGERETQAKRIYTAIELRKAVDGVLNKDNQAKLVIMGDFNDEPTNRSIFEMLYANNKKKNTSTRELYNLMFEMHNNDLKNDTGTYNYMGKWSMLDQIIVSQQLLHDTQGYHTDFDGGRIFKQDWMMYYDPNLLENIPNRTYGGSEYYGGYSDHLPVYMILRRN